MERKQRYGLRKLSIGVVSCFLGSVIYFGAGMTVNAEEIQPDNMEETASNDALAETSSDPILDESTPAEEAPATALAAPQEAAPAETAPAEETTLTPQDAQENIIDEKGEVLWDGITEDDVNPGVDSRNGATVTKPPFAQGHDGLDYYHINSRQDLSSLLVWDLRATRNEGVADDSYTKYYGVDAYIVTSYIENSEKMLVQVIAHETHEVLEEVEIPNDGTAVILESTRSRPLNGYVGNGNEDNYFMAYFNVYTTQLVQKWESMTDYSEGQVWSHGKVVYHSSLPQTIGYGSDQITSPVPNPISDEHRTSYTVVDGTKQYVIDENGNKVKLAEYTVVGYQGDNYHASEIRDINGFDVYKEEVPERMSGNLRVGNFVDGQETLVTYYPHPSAKVNGQNVVRTRVFINDGTEGNVFVEIRYALASQATPENFSDMSIWTTMFRSESLAPGQVTQTGNMDTPDPIVSYDLDNDGVKDILKNSAYNDANYAEGGVLDSGGGTNTSRWWIRNNRTLDSDNAEHVYIPQGTVRVHYIDEEGNVIKQLVTAKGENVTKEFAVKEATEVNDGSKVSDVTYSLSKKGSSYNVDTDEYKPATITYNGKTYYLKEVKTPTGTTEQEDVNVKTASGETKFTYNRVDAPTSGTIDSATIYDITYVYALPTIEEEETEVKGDVIVHYIDEEGNTIAVDVTDTPSTLVSTTKTTTTKDPNGNVVDTESETTPTGATYDTTDNKPEIIEFEGKQYKYTRIDESSAPEQGEVVEGTTEVTYVYKLVKGDVIVHYIDEEGNTIKTDVVDTPLSPTGTDYDTTDNKPEIIEFEGKQYKYTRIDESSESETGKVKEGTTEVTYVYKLVKGDVIVHYIDEEGNTIKTDVVDTPLSPTGTDYDTTDNKPAIIEFEGKQYKYTRIDESSESETGKVKEGTTEVTYVYKLVKGDVIVHYIDEEGNTIKTDVVDTPLVPTGTDYDTTDNKPAIIEFEGKQYKYTRIDESSASESGKVIEGTTEVTYVYKLVKGDVIVHYVDEDGNTIKEDVVDTPTSPTGTEYDTTDNKPQRITTEDGKVYELVPEKTEGEETGKVKEGTTEITYVYKLVKGDVIVHYVDEEGNTIKNDVVDTPLTATGTDYDTTDNKPEIIEFEGKQYKFTRIDESSASETGKVVEGTTEVTYVYKLVKGDVIVHYVDEDGNPIKEDVVDTPLVPTGTDYDTTDNKPTVITFDGKEYELVPTRTIGNENGKVVEGTTEVTYVYRLKKGDVVVHYVDVDGNPIKEDVVDTPLVPTGTKYDTTDNKPTIIEFEGKKYELVPTLTIGNEQGDVVEGTTHITYVYKLVEEEEKEIKGVERDIPRPAPTPVPPVVDTPTPEPKLPKPTPTPTPQPKPTPVQTGMETGVIGAVTGMITSLGAMVAFKKKDNE